MVPDTQVRRRLPGWETRKKYNPILVALVRYVLIGTQSTLFVFISLYGYLVWILSPNAVIGIPLILLTTASPFFFLACFSNWIALLAVGCRKLFRTEALYEPARYVYALTMMFIAKITFGHEIHGRENIPRTGGGLVVYYHPSIPLDCIFLAGDMFLRGGRQLGGIYHWFLAMAFSGLGEVLDFYSKRDRLVKDLKQGHLRAVAPGGGTEGAFSENYEVLWNGRVGFAEVAKECGVPVIPMFTANSQEATPVTTFGFPDLFKNIYEESKLIIFLPLFILPVKLRTFLGKPLYCRDDESPADFAERVKAAIQELRDKHQRRPNNIALAILERFGYPPFNAEADHLKSE